MWRQTELPCMWKRKLRFRRRSSMYPSEKCSPVARAHGIPAFTRQMPATIIALNSVCRTMYREQAERSTVTMCWLSRWREAPAQAMFSIKTVLSACQTDSSRFCSTIKSWKKTQDWIRRQTRKRFPILRKPIWAMWNPFVSVTRWRKR